MDKSSKLTGQEDYRVLHSGLIVVGVGLGPHPEVVRAEGGGGEDPVVSGLVHLEGLAQLLGGRA